MTRPIRIWTCAAWRPAYRCGGWASVRVLGGQVSGAAGGERYTTASRMALAGLVPALRDLPPADAAGTIEVLTTSPELAAFAGALTGPADPANAPEDDLDLWAQILAATQGRRVSLVRMSAPAGTPAAFAAAWAELAGDRAKASGPFSAAIPKANLAKVPGLELG